MCVVESYYTLCATPIPLSVRPSVDVCPSVRLSCMSCPLCNNYSSGWILSMFGTIMTSMRGCVMHNDIWPWPISSRSFSHDFVIKLLKYGTSCRVCSTTCTIQIFSYLTQMITNMRGCVQRSRSYGSFEFLQLGVVVYPSRSLIYNF